MGFTALSRRMTPRELTDTIERFESTAHETATAKGGRVVKLIGDEVMFVAIDAGAACDIALTLVEHFAGDPAVTPRGGLTYGALINRGGDYYGPVVNLAARLAELAVPNELLVTPELAAKVRDRQAPLRARRQAPPEGIRRAGLAADARAALTLRTPCRRRGRRGSSRPRRRPARPAGRP